MDNSGIFDYFLFYILLIINFLIVIYFIRKVSLKSIWINPLTTIILFYMLNYPFRGLVLLYGDHDIYYNFNILEINIAFTYSTVFCVFLLYGFYFFVKKDSGIKLQISLKREDYLLCHLIFLIVFSSYIYFFYIGKVYGLYLDIDDLYSDFSTNFISSFKPLGWFFVAYSMMIWVVSRQISFLIEAISVFLIIFASAFIATSKGIMVGLALSLFFVYNVFNKKPSTKLLLGLSFAFLCYSIYSYIIRYYGNVRGTFEFYDLIDNLETAAKYSNDTDTIMNLGANSSLARLAYLDGLILCIRKGFFNINRGDYIFGGISELVNFIPRFIWPDRPFFNFNIFLTSEIWGFKGLVSETPIGRIGESFFVLGYLGVIYGIFYGFLFRFMQNRFVNGDVFSLAIYFFILYNFILPDAFILYNLKPIVFGLAILYILKFIVKSVAVRKSRFFPNIS